MAPRAIVEPAIRQRRAGARRGTGASAVELLLALPVVLLLGLGVVQFCLVYQARHALEHALTQAARQGTVDHASVESILDGLARGLVPYLYGATDYASLMAAQARARAHVDFGLAAGWIRLRQRSPTIESFDDWAEPALDPRGDRIAGMVEIPNDNLDSRRLRMQPVSGIAGDRLGEPVGRASGQSLADANLLRLELAYGARLAVPLVGPLLLRTLMWWHGCSDGGGAAAVASDSVARLGLVRLPPPGARASAEHWACPFYRARDADGMPKGRIPLRASATMRMMSTARPSALTAARSGAPAAGSSGAGGGRPVAGGPDVATGPVIDEAPGATDSPGVSDSRGAPAAPGSGTVGAIPGVPGPTGPPAASGPLADATPSPYSNGFLRFGSDRAYPAPAPHPALCAG